MNQKRFAALAHIPGPQVSMWLSGRRRPGLTNAMKIELATKGAVPAESWARGLKRKQPKSKRSRKAA
jgi:DNA-binding transcriptional regulator YdaS (Cro superfamily)